jgi:sugar lactone lactonase YvrE
MPLKSKVLVAYPKNTWLENMVEGKDGNIYATNYPEGIVYKISKSGTTENYAKITGKIAGIADYKENEFLVTGWDENGKASIFRIDANKAVSKEMNIEGGMFPNGIIHLSGSNYIIADSYAGCIWLYDADKKVSSIWSKDPLFERSTATTQNPAANGLKIYKGYVYVSNTDKQILVRVPLTKSGPGKPELFADKVGIDDFTIDDNGNIYAATNVYSTVIKVTPEKSITTVAGLAEGVAGSTSLLYTKNAEGKKVLFVATSGGMAVPPPTGVEEGKIVILYLN